ncbi:HAMP domain-containing histidine kinase [Stappia taiwanensis]|uniref:histidine kinase n=1 Tax=Stappia taiwanensis TaxID=992267 RepID=A0A838XQS3_9HYPH|nr:HAMP domain-containing sensor histidine kinase [Stappia taiwanensis]MBA4610936.1 HAMP domain-containing histidine kinase [Stappia taiwanensis]GGE94696.1 ATPase [Stappia taiwanensis]
MPEAQATKRRRSGKRALSTRLITVAAIWSVLALAVAGVVLVALYREDSERSFDARLDVYVKAIVGEMAAGTPQEPVEPGNLGEPRFDLPASGWYWSVTNARSGEMIYASQSLFGDRLDLPPLSGPGDLRSTISGPRGGELRLLQRKIIFGEGVAYLIAVAGDAAELQARVATFAGRVALTLFVLGLGLVAAIFLQVRIGLRPLAALSASLAAVRQGDAEAVDEDLPPELAPLAVELNALVRSNREVVERSRTHVGNLAHALKTPLSVIVNEARGHPGPFADKVSEQAVLMRTQVDHHLERARMAAQRRVIGAATEVEPVLARLIRAMSKIYRDRDLDFALEVTGAPRFRGEEHDLEELAGNLIDNACKWARGRVRVEAGLEPDGNARQTLVIQVIDDGPGLSPEECAEALQRGRRLDETVPGTGLGLSIVVDLARLYGGSFTLEPAPSGGLCARLVLPALDDAVRPQRHG